MDSHERKEARCCDESEWERGQGHFIGELQFQRIVSGTAGEVIVYM